MVATTSLANSLGEAVLTAGAVLLALSGNAANIPIRIKKIKAWVISGNAGSYPPTFLQVNFFNDEFCQSTASNSGVRDSILDAGGQGAGCPGVGLMVPESLQLSRNDWGTGSSTFLAQALSLPQGARVLWHVELAFKF